MYESYTVCEQICTKIKKDLFNQLGKTYKLNPISCSVYYMLILIYKNNINIIIVIVSELH